ncbi:MAG: type II toxin-antitoxin system HipA family toxin [Pseudomonadota bacterium]
MGRRSHTQRLKVWMNGIEVAIWERAPGGESVRYLDSWIGHEQGRALSLSLPFTPGNQAYKGALVTAFFDNLLPDSEAIRRRLAQRYQSASIAPFDLLTQLGRDCVGALQLLPDSESRDDLFSIRGTPLSEGQIAQLLRDCVTGSSLGRLEHEGDLRLSIAGAQEKTALLQHAGQWHLPQGSTPTSHIFKLPMGLVGNMRADMQTSVENEWLCARIVAAFGLDVAPCEIGYFEDQKALIVQRFDRRLASDASWIVRLPQEDFCQATGTSPLHKYQADGGPGIAAIMDILGASQQAEQDRRNFFKAQLIFWLLAATDGHAKNFSIFHLPAGHFRATPLYDILSAHPIIGSGRGQLAPQKVKMAMAVRGSTNYYLMDKISRKHWSAQAQQVGLGAQFAEQMIEEVIGGCASVLGQVADGLPDGFPEGLANAIFEGVGRQCGRIKGKAAN